ncbi:type III-A CRISPR-associated protein Csm2 [Ligilactobacillus agilis]|uniref:type III-A CRISPR-associated protein Csm2 n=1 Tax=Ligilactobacillus agilis TaxID=1601 RepID=UPI001437C9C5|nr:type III-A CRISPR-associated protein Csm2 [Ligilactobacillus agilis]GET19278.1 CRISPR-associated protein Csm2 [Ligilactobacillus agilis]
MNKSSHFQTQNPIKQAPIRLTEENYLDLAKKVIKKVIERSERNKRNKRNDKIITTTQLRNILQYLSLLDNKLLTTSDSKKDALIKKELTYFKLRLVYAAGRDFEVKSFITDSNLIKYVQAAQTSFKEFKLYHHYLEALVAYHKFYIR